MDRIYLDNNATTALDPKVAAIIAQDLTSLPANPSASHFFGQEAKAKLLKARQTIASYLQVKPSEILFTSGGTESMNFLIRGILEKQGPCHVITSNVEHPCVEATLQDLEQKGYKVSYLSAGPSCKVSLEDVEKNIQSNTKLLVFSAVNGETGVKQDLEGLSHLALRHQILLIVDGVALLGKEPFKIPAGVTGMGFSGHKFHAPKGIGFVFLRSLTKIAPLLTGGGQEYGLRSGTENLTAILALAKAVSLLSEELPKASLHMFKLRDHLEQTLLSSLPDIVINGDKERISNVSNIAFLGVDAETLLIQLDLQGIAASHGSACSSGSMQPSKVLSKMGLPLAQVKSSIRFSLSRYTTEEEIDRTISCLLEIIPALR